MEGLVGFYILTGLLVSLVNNQKGFWIGIFTIIFWFPFLFVEAIKRAL